MKLSQMFKKQICRAIMLGFAAQLCGTMALAVNPPMPGKWQSQVEAPALGYIAAHEGGLDALVVEIVRKASCVDAAACEPSPALKRCYKRIESGFKTVLIEDVLEAMPELLSYALSKQAVSGTRAPRPQNPYAPGAVVGNVIAASYAGCESDLDISDELCKIIKLLIIILENLPEDCCEDIINTLTTCCALTQSNFEYTWSLIENISTGSNCCELTLSLIEEIEELRCLIDCKLGDFNDCCDCDNDCTDCNDCDETTRAVGCDDCENSCDDCCPTFDNVSQGLSEIYCTINDLEVLTLSCCEQTQSNFEYTWSLIENISSGSNCCVETISLLEEILDTLTQCCDDLADDIFDVQGLIIECCEQTHSNFESTWSLIEECCELTQTNFEFTWSLIENLENIVEECCEQTQRNFEITWSLIENLNVTATVDLTEVLSALDTCCEQTYSNFRYTWSLIENNTSDAACAPTAITQADVVGGILNLTSPGTTYCLSENITANITIFTEHITLQMNDRQMTGILSIQGSDINVENGYIFAPQRVDSAGSSAAVLISNFSRNVTLHNVHVTTEDATNVDGDGNGFGSRDGILNFGLDTTLSQCTVQTGSGADGINGGSSGSGIINLGARAEINSVDIVTGNGGFASVNGAGFGGASGAGILNVGTGFNSHIINSTIVTGNAASNGSNSPFIFPAPGSGPGIIVGSDDVFISHVTIVTGNGGSGVSNLTPGLNAGAGGNAGDGIVINDSNRCHVVNNYILKAGNGGNGGEGLSGISFNGNGGNGGNGISLTAAAINAEVRLNDIGNSGVAGQPGITGLGGAAGSPGQAVVDLNPNTTAQTGGAAIWQNFAHGIANTTVRYVLNANTGVEGGVAVNASPNTFANVFVP